MHACTTNRLEHCGPITLAENGPEKGGEKRPQKMKAKRVQPQSLDTFCLQNWGPISAPTWRSAVAAAVTPLHGWVGSWNCAKKSLQLETHVVKFSGGLSLSLNQGEPQSEPQVKVTVNLKARPRLEVELLLNMEEPIAVLLLFFDTRDLCSRP